MAIWDSIKLIPAGDPLKSITNSNPPPQKINKSKQPNKTKKKLNEKCKKSQGLNPSLTIIGAAAVLLVYLFGYLRWRWWTDAKRASVSWFCF